MKGTPEERFLAKVERHESGCLIWVGALVGQEPWMYGCFWDCVRRVKAHRWAYEHWVGPIPEGLVVRHVVCHNTKCVEWSHLAVGTQDDNMKDMVEAGRSPDNLGESNPNRKLTRAQVGEIRERSANGETRASIAAAYEVTSVMVGRIVRGQNWA